MRETTRRLNYRNRTELSLRDISRLHNPVLRTWVAYYGRFYPSAMYPESFFATLECELLDRCRFKTQAEARMAVFQFIEGFYNPRRRHSSLGYLSPIAFERQYAATALEPGAHEHAVVLEPVKERPGNVAASCTASVPAVRDSHSTRRRWQHAGRDEKMLSAEPKDHSKEEDRMPSNQIR